jgi:hypothetical protein
MNRFTVFAGLAATALLATLATVAPARAIAIAISPVPQRVMMADAVVIGKVEALEKNLAPAFQNGPKQDYVIAKVKIVEGLLGTKDAKEIRVGFIRPMAPPPPPPGGVDGPVIGRPIGRPGFVQPSLTEGQEGLFFLQKHPTENFYTIGFDAPMVDIKSEAEIKEARRTVSVLAEPMAALKSRHAEERTFAACVMVAKFRMWRGPTQPKEVEVPLEQSKLILKGLAEGNWDVMDFRQVNPRNAFGMLGAEQAGFKAPLFQPVPGQPVDPNEFQKRYADAAKEWLLKNADTFKLKQFVAK